MRVMTVVGTRPEIIKLSRVIAELDRRLDHQLVHTGQNFSHSLNEIFFEQLGIRQPDFFLEASRETPAHTIAEVIARSHDLFVMQQPDALLVLGDTNSALCTLSAKRLKIPIFHMEAGNRCFDQRVPEEINRRIVDHLSDINLVYTEHARRNLLAEGLPTDRVLKTGSPMFEVLAHYRPLWEASDALERLQLTRGEYFVVSIHREENLDNPSNFDALLDALVQIAEHWQWPLIVSTHPRTRKRLEQIDAAKLPTSIRFLEPLGLPDYIQLQRQSACVISDSGTITEESAMLGFPAITVRQAHERPEGMDAGVLVMAALNAEDICLAMTTVMAQQPNRQPAVVDGYGNPDLAASVVRILLSYTDFINRRVWHKQA